MSTPEEVVPVEEVPVEEVPVEEVPVEEVAPAQVDPVPSVPAPISASTSIENIRSTTYENITSQINGMLSTNRQASISVYDDAEGATFSLDSNGNQINNVQIKSVSMTQSYIDSITNAPVSASVTIVFTDNASFKAIDDEHLNWYKINGTDFPLRTV